MDRPHSARRICTSATGIRAGGRRDPIFLATKIGPATEDARASVEPSLQRLRRDQVDLVQLHGTSYTTEQADALLAPGGLLSPLEALRDEGLIRCIGFTSEDNNPAVYRFIESGRLDVMQICYNLGFFARTLEKVYFRVCHSETAL